MRIIKPSRIREHYRTYRRATNDLRFWLKIVKAAKWRTPADVKRFYGNRVDFVKVRSGRTVSVFDIANNNYRLIVAIHYNLSRVYVLRLLTHAEYDEDMWKEEL